MPQGIQRKRTAGWRMPEGCIYVGRPTAYGNPFHIARETGKPQPWVVHWYLGGPVHSRHRSQFNARTIAVQNFADWIGQDTLPPHLWSRELIVAHVHLKAALERGDLRGKDLACWCPLDQPCHRDVLVRLANS